MFGAVKLAVHPHATAIWMQAVAMSWFTVVIILGRYNLVVIVAVVVQRDPTAYAAVLFSLGRGLQIISAPPPAPQILGRPADLVITKQFQKFKKI